MLLDKMRNGGMAANAIKFKMRESGMIVNVISVSAAISA